MTESPERVLEVEDMTVEFTLRRGGRRKVLQAVKGVSFHVDPGETLAIVGESGSGKSTTARGVLRLVPITGGSVRLAGVDLSGLSGRRLLQVRAKAQMVFQDPYSSLDPSMIVADSVAEPLLVHTDLDRSARHERVLELLDLVGLAAHHAERYPFEFSGGQRQRIAIARAIAISPSLVVCDEAVSALDVSTQHQIVNLLEGLQARLGLSYLFISHDLAVVRNIAHRVAVMYLGRIVESGPVARVFGSPAHPYTAALLAAIPSLQPRPRTGRRRAEVVADAPDPTNPPPGCAFQPRCPLAMDVCRTETPPPTAVEGGGEVACWLQTEGPALSGKPLKKTFTAAV